MRISVLTGLFACAAIFTISSATVEAATNPLQKTINKTKSAGSALQIAKTSESPLAALIDEENNKIIKTESNNIDVKLKKETTAEVIKYVVAENDSLTKIGKKFNVAWQKIYDKNTSIENPNLVEIGQQIIIPNQSEQLEKRTINDSYSDKSADKVNVTSQRFNRNKRNNPETVKVTTNLNTAENRYTAGYCTWYAKSLRRDLPNNLGNANTWASRAASQGFATGSIPKVGAIGQSRSGMHVVYVTAVNGDGTVTISEMNWRKLYEVSSRVAPAESFIYIY